MIILVLTIVVFGLLAAVATKLMYRSSVDEPVTAPPADCSSCGGAVGKCGMDCMLESAVGDIEYYDDEELDAFAGRPSDAYTDDDAELFRHVMLTMRPDEVAGWSRSLSLRGVSVPDQIRDEMMLLIEG